MLKEQALIAEVKKNDRKKIREKISQVKKIETCSGVVITSLELILERVLSRGPFRFNQGVKKLKQVKVEDLNQYQQIEDLKKRMLYIAQSNKDYKGMKFSPQLGLRKALGIHKDYSLPPISQELIQMLKSRSSPLFQKSQFRKFSNRPILGPYEFTEYSGTFIGQFNNGQPDGLTLRLDEGEGLFYGEYKNGMANGIGFYGESKSTYFGEFKDCLPNGIGEERWSDGRIYKGEFKGGLPHGQGVLTCADGRKYVGEWKEWERDGVGLMIYENGDGYNGEWKDHVEHGNGVYFW